jgi:Regulator of ribonuclease activity B
MNRRFSIVFTVALAAAVPTGSEFAIAKTKRQISRSQLDAMFSQMLWGYFFLDGSRVKLELAASELTSKGYRVVGIEPADVGRYRLHVERIEVHSPASLDSRNQELYALAERLEIASYDGMDVGPVGPPTRK